MSDPILIDSLDFANQRRHMAGAIALVDLPRTHDLLAHTEGELSWSLEGGKDALSRSTLHLRLAGEFSLVCQRCLTPMPFRLEADSTLTLFTNEARLESACEDDDTLDAVMADPAFDVLAPIEDEVLLGLPMAPRHAHCEADIRPAGSGKPNPFAALAALKRKPE